MEEGNQYSLLDLTQLMAASRACFPDIPQASQPFTTMLGGGDEVLGDQFGDHKTTVATPSTTTPVSAAADQFGLEIGDHGGGSTNNSSRWPRQETLSLLQVRSSLDKKFKQTKQKGPLWDEVSRKMWEEHKYQRSGRKCREKFDNLYKYYKKTIKEGKAGRQDGKHYRFFHQLEALCGEPPILESSNTHLPKHNLNNLYPTRNNFIIDHQENGESHSQSNSCELETTSSINNDDDLSAIASMLNRSVEKKIRINKRQSLRRVKKSSAWKEEVVDFVDSQMRKLLETQEAWMERMLKTIEEKEEEMMVREEKWRMEEACRFDQEYKFWANERARIRARDTALLKALLKFTRKDVGFDDLVEIPNSINISSSERLEPEMSSFIQLRTSMEQRFQESGYSKEYLWEEIVAKMACLGYDWSVMRCEETWENISFYFNKTILEYEKKGSNVQNSRTCNYFQSFSSYHGLEIVEQKEDGLSTCNNSRIDNAVDESSFHILMN